MRKFNVTGMSCAACSSRIEKAVGNLSGVESCSVSLLTNSMGVEGSASDEQIINAVRKAGYDAWNSDSNTNASEQKNIGSEQKSETSLIAKRLWYSCIFLLLLMYLSMGHMMWNWPLPARLSENHIAMGLLQFILSLIVLVINKKFFSSGFKNLFRFSPNMDSLVALGAGISFFYSTLVLFDMTDAAVFNDSNRIMRDMHNLYFEGAAMIVTLITLGKLLESVSKGRTTSALKSLLKLAPDSAVVIRGGKEISVPVSEVKEGDVFVLRPGDKIPADGIVIEGESAVNESSLTGESIPVEKKSGDDVQTSTLNISGFLKCRAIRVGKDTTLSKIIALVENAAATKAPVAKIADKVSGVFVPVVIGIAAVTAFVWLIAGQSVAFALSRGIAVLVISCPCALGLATPVAIMVAGGVGAKNGILFKTSASLEEIGKIKTAVLDKTGTVTKGEPVVTDLIPWGGTDPAELVKTAASLEEKSSHPLAKAVVQYASEKEVSLFETREFVSVPGKGVRAEYEDEIIAGGSLSYISSFCSVEDELEKKCAELSADAKTPLVFCKGKNVLGIIAVADALKEDSAASVDRLKKMGIKVVMLTGDNKRVADSVGKAVGADEVIAGVLPGEKEAYVAEFMKTGKTAMVGDGINDAPALVRADVGVAIGAGADVAIDSADIVLVKNSLSDFCSAVLLGRRALRNIHENLFWAFVYNVAGIPLAAGVFYNSFGWSLNPMFCAAAMGLSSFFVVTNALRLNMVRIRNKINVKEEKTMVEKKIKVEGMMCAHCEAHVKEALESVAGIEKAVADHNTGDVLLTMEPSVTDESIVDAVKKAGYSLA